MGDPTLDIADWDRVRLYLEENKGIPYALLHPNNKKMIVVANIHKGIGCSYHRVQVPASLLSAIGMDIYLHDTVHISEINWAVVEVIFFNRVPTFPPDQLREKIKKHNIKVVVDIDDHWILYPHHEMAKTWKESKANEQIQQWLVEADMVFTTNARLKAAADQLNSNVHILPNALPFGSGQFTSFRDHTEKVNFIYAAGSSHLHDLELLRPVMKRLGTDSQFRANGNIILAGYDHSFGEAKVESPWPRMLNIVKQAINHSILPIADIDHYMSSYYYASVALAPLEKGPFNACKSNLKILEAGCKFMPIICSNVEPYIFDAECPGVILCDTPKEWLEAIRRLLMDYELRYSLGQALGEYVRQKYNINEVNRRRVELFRTLD